MRAPKVNPAGVAAGLLMLLLPFLGPWWRASLGEMVEVQLSPFSYRVSILGESISSRLADYLLFGVKLSVVLGGALLLAGSLFPNKWWSRRLARFGAMKVLWLVVSLVCLLVVAAAVLNHVVPSMLGEKSANVRFSIPYLSGSSKVEISSEDMGAEMPIELSFTWIFWLAVVVAALGVASRVVAGRMKSGKLR